ncbi:MAG: c-type cytochrome [Burkholderiales bacterium]|nr:c-type cytochrome [Burkholderiales bacterium]
MAAALVGPAAAQGDAARGEYLAKAGGCVACHTESGENAVRFAGGPRPEDPFRHLLRPEHHAASAGRHRALDRGRLRARDARRAASGRRELLSAFPYPSYTLITDADLRDLWSYLRALPPSEKANRPHELDFPFGWRFLVSPWKWLFFTPGPFAPDPQATPEVNRGAYLVRALGHCGECHHAAQRPRRLGPRPASRRGAAGRTGSASRT